MSIIVRWQDARRSPVWHEENTGWGSQRAMFPKIPTQSTDLRMDYILMPSGQRSPWHGSGGWPRLGDPFPPLGYGFVFPLFEGEVEWSVGGEVFSLKPLDMIVLNVV